MRWLLILLAATIAVPAAAADVARFDGIYNGSLTLKPGLDGPACASQDAVSVHVAKGQITPDAGQLAISGVINLQGDIDGHMRKADGSDVTFVGHAGMGDYEATPHIVGSIVDEKTNCGWALRLMHE